MRYKEEKSIDKIKKLLALASSPNEHEAQSALLKAQELLAKHNLTMEDVTDCNITEDVIQYNFEVSFTKMEWRMILATIIADNFRCYCWGNIGGSRGYGVGFTFLGKESDVEICKTIYIYAKKCIETNIKRLQKECKEKGYSSKGVAKSYGYGFCVGLKNKFRDQVQEHQEWGIILSKPKDVVQKYEEINSNFKNRTNKPSVNTKYYEKGIKDGNEFSPNALTGSTTKQQSPLLLA